MARTQAVDYDRKREMITRKAAKLFASKGFAGASVSELAETCKISKSLIYHYYPSKEAILYAVMSDHMDTLIGIIESGEHKASDPQDELRALTRALLHCYIGAADYQKILLYELQFLPSSERNEIIAKQRCVINHVEDMLGRIMRPRKPGRAFLRTKVMLYFGMLNWTHTWFRSSGPVSRNELADEIAGMTLLSLKAG